MRVISVPRLGWVSDMSGRRAIDLALFAAVFAPLAYAWVYLLDHAPTWFWFADGAFVVCGYSLRWYVRSRRGVRRRT